MATLDKERGERLVKIRKSLGENQVEFGTRFGKTGPAICNYEKGRLPEDEILKKLCEMGFSLDWLLTGEGQMYQGVDTSGQPDEHFTAFLNRFEDGVTVIQDGAHKFFNKALKRIMGYTNEDMLDKTYDTHAFPAEKERIRQIYQGYTMGGELPEQGTFAIRCKDGTIKDLRAFFTSIQYGAKPAILAVVRDGSQQRGAKGDIDTFNLRQTSEERKLARVLTTLLKELIREE
ncbi:MAG: PAS domain S-box protein [Gemmatimonadota bacterium]|nr:MAG: PAS domain S-box protein [Gemmatimonadota bacterium]